MRSDFHYYALFCLAQKAGFSNDEAKTIAYASQYVDDAEENEEIRVGQYSFDTIRTAHYGLESTGWDVQKKIFMPFHFLPPEPLGSKSFTYITKHNSKIANELIKEALSEKKDRDLKLIRLGVALHTYADTWSHEGFSGREHNENDVEDMKVYNNDDDNIIEDIIDWFKDKGVDFVADSTGVHVGHMECISNPDIPSLHWEYRNYEGEKVDRKNYDLFFDAAEHLFSVLAMAAGNKDKKDIKEKWDKIKGAVREIIFHSMDKDEAIKLWKKFSDTVLDDYKYEYRHKDWRREAMRYKEENSVTKYRSSKFAKFHKAAHLQRQYVIRRVFL